MNYKGISFFSSLFLSLFLWNGIALSEQIIVPSPKQSNFKSNYIIVGSDSRLIIPIHFRNRFQSTVLEVENYLKSLDQKVNIIDIVVKILPNQRIKALRQHEGYTIEIFSNKIVITGKDYLGALHGLTSFEALMRNNEGKMREGKIADWPDLKTRALHIVLRYQKPSEIKRQIQLARFGHYNTLIIQMKDDVRFNTMEEIAGIDAWTKEEFLDVVQFARENGLDVIPEIKLLTHQQAQLKNIYPQVMYNKVTYHPKRETYSIVLPMIDEVIDSINPRAFHIGHDEVAGLSLKSKKKWLRDGEESLPRDLFLADVKYLHKYLKDRGIETWMWGDMLIAPKEFPGMFAGHLHGIKGYSSLRNKIPKGIVICDWHYFDEQFDFPSTLSFAKAGHKVLGATWKKERTTKNFSRYVAKIPKNVKGMIATTWFSALKKDIDALNKIIQTSANIFWNAKYKTQSSEYQIYNEF
ncbi:MAG: beta-N-acetylhexosaminidase [Candidatus Jettenia sp.]|nr:MAG: beta-N-acetylhexosaminidase [Candidatus Jettenia sp.]